MSINQALIIIVCWLIIVDPMTRMMTYRASFRIFGTFNVHLMQWHHAYIMRINSQRTNAGHQVQE